MDTKKALELRAERKKHKPHFVRQNAGKKIEVGTKYRKPRGYQSKMRRRKAGYLPMPSQGYRAPVLVRGTDATGKYPLVIHTLSDIAKVGKNNSAIIGSSVGAKKRIMLLEALQKNGTPTSHDVATELAALQAVFTKRKDEKKKIEADAKKKALEEAKKDEKTSDSKKTKLSEAKDASSSESSVKSSDAKPSETKKTVDSKKPEVKSESTKKSDADSDSKDEPLDEKKKQEKILINKKTAM